VSTARSPKNSAPFFGLGFSFGCQRLLHFLILEKHKLVIRVAVSVVRDQKLERFLLSTLGLQPSRAFRYELHANEDVKRERDLKDVRDSPGPGAREIATSENDEGRKGETDNVVRIPRLRDESSAAWVTDFLHGDHGSHQKGGETETDNDSPSNEH
jgi:hypothetical protein